MSGLRWNKAFALEQAADDAELLEELLEIFKESFSSDLGLIEKGIEASSPEQVSAAAHSIKGAAASLGIEGINDIAKAVEDESRTGSITIARAKLPELKNLLAEILAL